MSGYQDALRRYAAVTEPRPDLSFVPRRPARRKVALALAAAAILAIPALWPRAPEPVSRVFAAAGEADLGDAVHARWEGDGRAVGDARTLGVAWDAGTISLEVAPDRGVSLTVQTGEATIRVIGTGFAVRRDALGTGVDVRHGVVGVTCAGREEERVEEGRSVECLPVTPAALLGRARAQMRRGDAPDAVLETIRAARVGAEGEVAAELGLLEAWELSGAGREEEALRVADAALAGASNRRIELLRLATRLAVELGGCARAKPYADALATAGEATPCGE